MPLIHLDRPAPCRISVYEKAGAMTVATLALKGAHVEISADRQTWKPLAAKAGDGMAAVSIALKDLSADRKVYLRVKQGRG